MNANQKLYRHARGLLIGLSVQFLLGMWITFFVEFPENGDAHANWQYAMDSLPIVLHIILGTLLVIGTVSLFVQTIRCHVDAWRIPAVLAFISLLIAWISGEIFVATQNDSVSYLMSIGFLVGILSLSFGLIRNKVN